MSSFPIGRLDAVIFDMDGVVSDTAASTKNAGSSSSMTFCDTARRAQART